MEIELEYVDGKNMDECLSVSLAALAAAQHEAVGKLALLVGQQAAIGVVQAVTIVMARIYESETKTLPTQVRIDREATLDAIERATRHVLKIYSNE